MSTSIAARDVALIDLVDRLLGGGVVIAGDITLAVAEVAEQVHARFQDWTIDAVTLPAQNRDLSGHEGDMLLNAAYLVEADRVEELRELVAELEARYRELGAHIELTGPWPPYNFVSGAA